MSDQTGMTFEVPAEECQAVTKWIAEHPCRRRHKYAGAIGGTIAFRFIPTSIGNIVKIDCCCGESYDASGLL